MTETERKFLQYNSQGIAELLKNYALSVPFYQRSYSWQTDDPSRPFDVTVADDRFQINEYWEDLKRNFYDRRDYFIGTIVLSASGQAGRRSVIDGQQRLATTSLLLAAIRDAYRNQGAEDHATSTERDFIGSFDRRASRLLPKFILNTDDREYYDRVVLDREDGIHPQKPSQKLLANAYWYLRLQVDSFVVEAGSDAVDKLTELSDFLSEKVQTVAIDVASDGDAFQIFETLNDRGADLTIADLLKNYLFSQAGEGRLAEVQANWTSTLTHLDLDRVGNQRFTDFARHLMSSKYGRTREKELYSRIRRIVNSSEAAITFAQELKDASRRYYALLTVDSDYWGDYSQKVRDAMEMLVDLKLEQYRPLMLAALGNLDRAEIERLVPTLLGWVVRGLVAGTLGGGVAEGAFCDAAMAIEQGRAKTTEDIIAVRRMGELIPSDGEFRLAFEEWRTTKGSLARYVLRVLELEYRGESEPMLVVNPNAQELNLEHILPKSPRGNDWNQFSEEERTVWSQRLGNMCLLQKGPNGRIGNKPWATKRPVLSQSSLQLTSRLAANSTWNKTTIARNQRELATYAVSAWPLVPRI